MSSDPGSDSMSSDPCTRSVVDDPGPASVDVVPLILGKNMELTCFQISHSYYT